MNKSQQIILAILTPIILFISGFGYIEVFWADRTWFDKDNYVHNGYIPWNEFDYTWKVWLVTFILIGVIEYFIFLIKVKK